MANTLRSAMLGITALAPLLCGGSTAQAGDVLIYDFASPYLQRMYVISPGAGDAPAANTVTHMIDPWPRYVGNRRIPANASRMADVYERYRDVRKLPLAPPPLSPTGMATSGFSSGAVSNGGGGNGK